jgi:hypothetical protein
MVAQASALEMEACRFSRPLRGVSVIAILEVGLYTMQHVEVPPGAGELHLLVPDMVAGVYIHCRCLPDRVEVTR